MISEHDKNLYWILIVESLRMLKSEVSFETIETLKKNIESLEDVDERELFYHSEPLDVAKNLSGLESLTEEQVQEYIKIRDKICS